MAPPHLLQQKQPFLSPSVAGLLISGYCLLILYVSLYPGTDWRSPMDSFPALAAQSLRSPPSKGDIVSNLLAYIPLGLLAAYWGNSLGKRILLAAVVGFSLSTTVEIIQAWLPSRVPSLVDVAMNTLGSLAGGLCARYGHAFFSKTRGLPFSSHVREGPAGPVGIAAVLIWALSQWSPFVPSIDLGTIRDGLLPVRQTLSDMGTWRTYDAVAYFGNLTALGIIVLHVVDRPRRLALALYLAAATVVLCGKVFIVGRALSLESLAGLATAGLLLAASLGMSATAYARLAIIAILAGLVSSEIAPRGGALSAFNWIPMAGETENNLNGISNILGNVWPFVALAYFASLITPRYLRREVSVLGGLGVVAMTFALELLQQYIPGRHGDLTPVLLAGFAWCCAWYASSRLETTGKSPKSAI